MRLAWFYAFLLVSSACFVQPEPQRYVVVRGDTLGQIADAHGVSVDQLRTWNGIEGDLIEVDQVLLIHTDAGAVEVSEKPAPRRRRAGPLAPVVTSGPPADALVLPAPKPCLTGPTELDADADGMSAVASRGLSSAQVKTAFDAFIPKTTSCLPDDFRGMVRVSFDLRIGCDGLVDEAEVVRAGGLPDAVLACLTDRMKYAAFPAHDLPNGEQARVPLSFTWTPPE